MPVMPKSMWFTAALVTVFGAEAAAQAKCEIDESSPEQLKRAMVSLQLSEAASRPGQGNVRLKEAVKLLTDSPEKIKNTVGRQYLLGKTLVAYTMYTDVGFFPTRGLLGYTTNPEQPVDIVAAIDSAFDAVEAAKPECVADMRAFRMQKAWSTLAQQAVDQLNGGNLDSAAVLAHKADMLYSGWPYPTMVLASVAQQKNDMKGAFAYMERTLQAAGDDTSFVQLKRQTLVDMANLAVNAAELAKDPSEKQALRARARSSYQAAIAAGVTGQQAEQARVGIADLMLSAGDTAAFRAQYVGHLQDPAKYGAMELLNFGVAATRAGLMSDAAKLFGAAAAQHPYNRDAVFNTLVAYVQTKQMDKMMPLATRLTELDPNNPTAWNFLAAAYSSQAGATKDAVQKKALNAKAVDLAKKAEDMGIELQITEFSPREDKATLSGTLTNRGKAAKTVSVTVEFLDASGAVVGTQSAEVGSIAAGKSGKFTVSSDAKNVAAFRYKPIS